MNKFQSRSILYLGFWLYVAKLAALVFVGWLGNPWYVLIFDPLDGVAYGAVWVAAVNFANKEAPTGPSSFFKSLFFSFIEFPSGLGATAQSLLSASFGGLGTAAGSFFGSRLYDSFGPEVIISAVIFLFHFFLFV
jgi:hypothetical protein